MRKISKSALLVAAGLSAPMIVASTVQAAAIVDLTIAYTATSGSGGTWTAYEQNAGDTPQSGLGGIEFSVTGSGGITVATSRISLPDGNDDDLGETGFDTLRQNDGVPTGGTTVVAGVDISAYQFSSTGYEENSYNDATNYYTGVGNVAETINTGDSGGTPTDKSVADPVVIGTGTYTNNGSGGMLTVSSDPTLVTLLPDPMPTPAPYGSTTVSPVSTFSPDTVNNGSVTIPGVPEPTSVALLAVGAIGMVKRRRRTV